MNSHHPQTNAGLKATRGHYFPTTPQKKGPFSHHRGLSRIIPECRVTQLKALREVDRKEEDPCKTLVKKGWKQIIWMKDGRMEGYIYICSICYVFLLNDLSCFLFVICLIHDIWWYSHFCVKTKKTWCGICTKTHGNLLDFSKNPTILAPNSQFRPKRKPTPPTTQRLVSGWGSLKVRVILELRLLGILISMFGKSPSDKKKELSRISTKRNPD